MRRFTPLLLAALLAGCAVDVHEDQIDQVRAGMTRDEVKALLGVPDRSTAAPGQDCAYYIVMKSFWRRTPWSTTERYSVCYTDNRVETYGRIPDGKSDKREM